MNDRRNQILKLFRKFYYTLFFIFITLILFITLPKQGMFKYQFQKGKPWQEQSLYAPFDFPILKDKQLFEAEKDSVLKSFVPYFTYDSNVDSIQLSKLETATEFLLQNTTTEIDLDQMTELIELLLYNYKQLYATGILEHSIENYEVLKGKTQINKVQNNVASSISTDSVLSLKTAYLQLNENIAKEAVSNTLLLEVLDKIDFNKFLEPNLIENESRNESRIDEIASTVSNTRGVIQSGERIISKGDLITVENYNILESLRQAYNRKSAYSGWLSWFSAGLFLMIVILMLTLVIYLQNFNRSIFEKKRNFSLILTTIAVTFVLARLVNDSEEISLYVLPICILPIIIRTFLGARIAIFIHIITVLMIGLFPSSNSFEYVLMQLVAGTITVVTLSRIHRRGHLVYTALILIGTYSIMNIAFVFSQDGSYQNIDWESFKWYGVNGVLIMIAYPLIWVFEKIFGFVSDVTLMELSDTNHPLLRKLAEEAPGSFQHSMQVANLAEQVIMKIGGNPLLVRAGALYHDVGKIASPQFFIENQSSGFNPHSGLDNKTSALKIIGHVDAGVALARKYNIPEMIIDFIKMHHGTSMAKYFYLKQKEETPDKEVKVSDFSYPGPNPLTRETAVLMLADGVEAASRSLPEKNEESLRNIIDKIIDAKINNHELDDAPITFMDIKKTKEIFLEKLKNIYHLRIQYPEEKKTTTT